MSTFVPKGPIAETQLDLFMLTVWVTGFIFIAVGGVYTYAIIRFREKPNDNRPLPTQGHGNPLIEICLNRSFDIPTCYYCCADFARDLVYS